LIELTMGQLTFLSSERVARLATVDVGGGAHVVPVCFAYHEGVVYTPIDEKPKRAAPEALQRVRNLLRHPEVCLLVDRYAEDWTELAWLQVRGTASLVEDAAERAQALGALRARYPQYRAMDLESRPLVRITPTRAVSWSATPPHR